MKVPLNKRILSKNEECALKNSTFFADNNILCLNFISSPGSGKTTILSRIILDTKDKIRIGVIEGDIKTDTDARKIRATGAEAVQIETRGACHLSAEQVTGALDSIHTEKLDIVIIENVGNLVCPSSFDLGEQIRVVVLSVPEGDDKPTKYPGTFAKANVLLINKIDLHEHIDFDIERVISEVKRLNSEVKIFKISALTGEGMSDWCSWLMDQAKKVRKG